MHHCEELRQKIQAHVPLHGARLDFIIRFVTALIVVRSVTLSAVASALNPNVLPESVLERFYWQGQTFDTILPSRIH